MKILKPLFLLTILTLFFTSCDTQSQPENLRKQNFDFNWKFYLGDASGAEASNFDDNSWRNLDVPHDWSIEGQIKEDNPTGNDGGYFPAGIGWYRKEFYAPKAWKDQKVFINFEGVYMNSEVFVNGKSVGKHPYGYTSFEYDLTPFLNFDAKNVIAVKVDNSMQRNCRWYSGSGIYRHVWLKVMNPVHLVDRGLFITTPFVRDEQASVVVSTLIKNETSEVQVISVSTVLLDKEEIKKGTAEDLVEIAANSEKEITQTFSIKSPKLWSPETPYLYHANIELKNGVQVLDQLQNNFGVRSISFDAENGFMLNGKKVLLNGGCAHHDNGCLGAKAYDRAEERKVELLKSAGFNAVRTSHNPPSPAFLDACDHLGLLVVDEAFDGWRTAKEPQTKYDYSIYFDEWWESDLSAMVLRDRNHPSIIMWSIGNEIIERTKPEAIETAHMLATKVRKLDPTRPVTSAMTSWGEGWEIFDPLMAEHDVCGYNYQLHMAESDHDRVPNRVIVNTESYPANAFFIWNQADQHNYIIGDFVWTAIDYLGESSIGRYYYPGEPDGQHWERNFYPWHGAYCGDIDLTGWKKPISHYRDMLWNNREKVYMAVREPAPAEGEIKTTMWAVYPTWESWTWPGHEGKDIEVEVYSKYPSVRLYLDNKLIGEQLTGKDQEFKTRFKLKYAPGEIKAVGVSNNQEMESSSLKTSGAPDQITLKADRTTLKANGQDLLYVQVEVADNEGNRVPYADNLLHFEVEGAGSIIGVDNANLKNTDPYVSNERKAWKGKALVVIKSNQTSGTLQLMVSGDGLKPATLSIETLAH